MASRRQNKIQAFRQDAGSTFPRSASGIPSLFPRCTTTENAFMSLVRRVAYYVLRVPFSRTTHHARRNPKPETQNLFTGPPKHPQPPFAQSPNRSRRETR
jgi:hypothetical protein